MKTIREDCVVVSNIIQAQLCNKKFEGHMSLPLIAQCFGELGNCVGVLLNELGSFAVVFVSEN